MAFDPDGLSDVAALNRGRTLFEYGTRDPLASVLAAGYFDAAHGLLTTGDSILVSADDGEAIVRAAIVNGGAVVAVSQGGAGTANLSIPANTLAPGSVARSVVDELKDIAVPVTRFGAVGDGATDDSAAFAQALASGAKWIDVPYRSGGYLLNSGITIPAGVVLGAVGRRPSIKFGTGSISQCITFSGDGGGLIGLAVDFDKDTKSGSSTGVVCSTNNELTIRDCSLVNAKGNCISMRGSLCELADLYIRDAGIASINMQETTCEQNTLKNIRIKDSGSFGVYMTNGAHENYLTNISCPSNGLELIGITYSCWGNIIENCRPTNTGDNGISVSGYGNIVRGCLSRRANFHGFGIYGEWNIVDGCKAEDSGQANAGGGTTSYCGFSVIPDFGGRGRFNKVRGCVATDNQAVPTMYAAWKLGASNYNSWTNGEVITVPAGGKVYRVNSLRIYYTDTSGTCGASAPTHTTGSASDGGVTWTFLASNMVGHGEPQIAWAQGQTIAIGNRRYNGNRLYQATTAGTTGSTAPTHTSSTASDGGVTWQHITDSGNSLDASFNSIEIEWNGGQNEPSYSSNATQGNEINIPGMILKRMAGKTNEAMWLLYNGTPQSVIPAGPGSFVSRVNADGSTPANYNKALGTGTTGWEKNFHYQETTASALGSASNSINTTNKYEDKVVLDTTNDVFYIATGSTSTSPWRLLPGNSATGAITPA